MSENKSEQPATDSASLSDDESALKALENDTRLSTKSKAVEVGGRKGPDPVRYGDWEKGGRCIDF